MIRAWHLLHTEIIRLPSIHPFQLDVSTLYLAPSSSSPHLPIRRTSDFNPLFKLHYFVQNLLFPILICTPSTTPMLAPGQRQKGLFRCLVDGAVVSWLEHPPVDREDGGSITPPPFRSLGNFVHPTLPMSFARD